LGRHDVDGLLDELSSAALAEWLAYFQLEPWGEERADLRAGIVASTVANVNRPAKRKKAFEPKDFMPRFDAEPEAPETGTLRLMAQMRAALGGRSEL
jgi:hypothetical protein